MSELVETQFGYHIIKVAEKQAAARRAARGGQAARSSSTSTTRTGRRETAGVRQHAEGKGQDRHPHVSDAIRLDVWLDVACLFKTRSEAKRACEGGKVDVNGEHAKPHRVVREGDRLRIGRPFGRHQDVDRPHRHRPARQEGRGPGPLRRRHAEADRGGNRDATDGARLPRRVTGGRHARPPPPPRDPASRRERSKMSRFS